MVAVAKQAPENQPKARIFVSYSRKDMNFVDRLEAALNAHGFEPLIDRRDIAKFEDWWKRIEELIVHSDTVVFVISPDAVESSVCQREVSFAQSLNKRLAPIVCRHAPGAIVPEQLRRLNWIDFQDDARFSEYVNELVTALETDIEWIRDHTRFGEQARRWDVAGRPNPHGLLLRPPVLDEAEAWFASRPPGAPEPTEATAALLNTSRTAYEDEKKRTARIRRVLVIALIVFIAALIAFNIRH